MSVLVVIATICCLVFAVWMWLKRPRQPSPPMYPGALPIIGHIHQIFGDRKHLWNLLKKLFKNSLENGGVVEFWLGPHLYYVITDPEDALTLSNTCLSKHYVYDFAKDFLNNGLITAQVPIWKAHRKLLNPSFNQQVLNTYVSEMNEQSADLVSKLASEVGKAPFDVRHYVISFILSTVSRTSLGLNVQDQSLISKDYAEAVEDLFALYCDRFLKVWLHLKYIFNWTSMKRRHDKLISVLANIINPVIHKRKAELQADTNIDYDSGKFKPVLDQMLHLAKEQDAFTDDDIREHLDTLVAASYDTTSSAMTFILLVIGSYQDVQDRIFNELQEVFDHKEDHLSKQDLQKLVYLEAVMKEVMRLYPPVPLIGRKNDMEVKLKNYTVRPGTSSFIGTYGINRHPMWGPDATEFRPERWLDTASLPLSSNAYASFGIGKRNCIGKLYGMTIMKTALAHILRRYHITGDISKVVCEFDVVLKPVEGHHISLKLRE